MEVHHHTHHPKKWKEYITEFLMLFLAVTLGFFAENIREHIINREKEHSYIENLIRDLKEQNEQLTFNISKNKEKIKALDVLVDMRNKDLDIKANNDSVIKLFVHTSMWDIGILKINDITIQQIKSTGGMSLIRSNISNLISAMDMSNQEVRSMQHYTEMHAEEATRMMYELTDVPSIFNRKMGLNREFPQIYTDEKKIILKFFNLVFDTNATLVSYNKTLAQHQVLLKSVLEKLKEEYNHKD